MASAPEGETALPPLILDRVRVAKRLVVPATASDDAWRIALALSDDLEIALVVAVSIDGRPQEPPTDGDLLVHGVPDVFGRILDEPAGWESLVVVDRICGSLTVASPWRIEVGEESPFSTASLSEALAKLDKHLRQQRRVRPLFSSPPAMGLPYIAPEGVALSGEFGRVETPEVPGLADLVVVRPDGDPSTVR